ncbi:MAG: hypothetical protein EHM45_11850 [Desulfobacteraceae bacterium]|nr:MAG: hypothetical protein EHM45_11850 [Desulfobacteraceae bacterium]
MIKDSLSFWDYLKAAFNLKVPVKGLGHLPLNKLALGGLFILGFGHPGFFFLGLAFEIAYLLFLSGNPRFQNLVGGIILSENKKNRFEKQLDTVHLLNEEAKSRYQKLESKCDAILNRSGLPSAASGFQSLQSVELDQLRVIFLKLLYSQQTTKEVLNQVSETVLRADLRRIEDKLSKETEDSAVWRSLKGTLEIQNRRLENLLKAKESLKVTEAELDRIEKQVTLISEETAVRNDPQLLSQRLDGVIRSLEDTQKWITDNNELFAALESAPQPVTTGYSKAKLPQKE